MFRNKFMFLRTTMKKMETQITGVESSVDSSVDTKLAEMVNSAPASLDTLKELATALGNDPNFATTMVNALANKAPQTAIDDVVKYVTVTDSSNIYTLNQALGKNFAIETTNATAKTITFSNIPQTDDTILSISVKLKYTNAATMTFPAGTAWQNTAAPTLVAGKIYFLLFTSYDKGTSWLASAVGAW